MFLMVLLERRQVISFACTPERPVRTDHGPSSFAGHNQDSQAVKCVTQSALTHSSVCSNEIQELSIRYAGAGSENNVPMSLLLGLLLTEN